MKTNINENAQSSASQKAIILEYMKQGHSISPMEALNLFGCFRLGARIAIQNHSEEYYYQKVLDEYNKDVSKGITQLK